ncbi:hypothetical protein [Pararhizobium qamdonense]|uniref:hypothetical protein n=1 Tax=Pararhizobium qamdonense TaxID=3031126 RepID=UPI0023E14368|nr:hypothetical protein [Pararhizobium qamdonense]
MTEGEIKKRRRRGASPRGEFEAAKSFATASEDARIAADKRKSEVLRMARLQREQEHSQA